MKDILEKIKNEFNHFLNNFARIILLLFLFSIFLISIYFYNNYFSLGDLKVSFLDVGQGDAVFIETPSHKKIMIDAGANDKVVGQVDKELNLFDKKFNLAIFSHPDEDHVGGFISLFSKYNFSKIIWNGDDNKKTAVWEDLKSGIGPSSIIANCGDIIDFQDGVQMYILHPEVNDLIINESNTNSIVILLLYENYSFLFTGDLDKEGERKIFFNLENCFPDSNLSLALKNLTVLKDSHHGSNTGNSEMFLKKVSPVYSVISVGKKNKYNLPNPEALSRIQKYSKYVLRTDNSGTIKFILNSKSLEIKKEK